MDRSLLAFAALLLVGLCACGDELSPPAEPAEPPEPPELPETALIPAGSFWMGCNEALDESCLGNERPQHEVDLAAFRIDLYPVTVERYRACVDAAACTAPSVTADWCSGDEARHNTWSPHPADQEAWPVNCVTWSQAAEHCAWRGARLPTEAEWEKAARGGCELRAEGACAAATPTWPWGEDAASCAWAVVDAGGGAGCGAGSLWQVGSREAGRSPYGLYDMAGNAWEWVADRYGEGYYAASPSADPQGPGSGPLRVLRGGAFHETADHLRAGMRAAGDPGEPYRSVGFRCVAAE